MMKPTPVFIALAALGGFSPSNAAPPWAPLGVPPPSAEETNAVVTAVCGPAWTPASVQAARGRFALRAHQGAVLEFCNGAVTAARKGTYPGGPEW
jgi:hypothetical protein